MIQIYYTIFISNFFRNSINNLHFICFIGNSKLILIYDNQLFNFRWISYCDGEIDEKILDHLENHHFESKEVALWYVNSFFRVEKVIGIDLMKLDDKLF